MPSLRHLQGRNFTCTEIQLSKINGSQLPIPHGLVRPWFQGNGSHLQRFVRRPPGESALELRQISTQPPDPVAMLLQGASGLCFLSNPSTVAYPVDTCSKLGAARWRTTRGDSVPYLRLALNVGPHASPGVSGVSLSRLQTRSAHIRAILAVADNPRKATPT